MDKRFKLSTLFLAFLTGASTLAMIVQNKPETYITGGIAIVIFGFVMKLIEDYKK
jgi:hypothetical protein